MPAEVISVTASHIRAANPTVDGATPEFDQGERDESPAPAPSERRLSERAAVTKAPPATAAQDTPDPDDSFCPTARASWGPSAPCIGDATCDIYTYLPSSS